MNLNVTIAMIENVIKTLPFVVRWGAMVKEFIGSCTHGPNFEWRRTETACSATTVGNGTGIEGFERTQTMDPVDKVNMGPMIDT